MVVTLAIGALGGALFALLDLPLAWMLGALATTTRVFLVVLIALPAYHLLVRSGRYGLGVEPRNAR